MVKTIGARQREFLAKYVAPLFLDFDFRPAMRGLYSLWPAPRQNPTEALEERILYEVDSLIKNPNQNTPEKENTLHQLLNQYAGTVDRKDMSPVYRGLMHIFKVGEAV